MQPPLIATIVIAVLAVLYGALTFARRRSWQALVRGIGVATMVTGAWFFGLMGLLTTGFESLISWCARLEWTRQLTNSSIAMGVGLVLIVCARFLSPGQSAVEGTTSPPDGQRATGSADRAALPKTKPAKPAKRATALDAEDAEIEALLRSHGIE